MWLDAFDPADVGPLLELYYAEPAPDEKMRRPVRRPWNLAALDEQESTAQARLSHAFAASWNRTCAVRVSELIPPCWPQHEQLAQELAVMVWSWYYAHLDERAAPFTAVEFRTRYVVAFRTRLPKTLGDNGLLCQENQHDQRWREAVDKQLEDFEQRMRDDQADQDATWRVSSLDFGFAVERA
ncbi:hypothetical protein M8C13_07415 [Crossiella sp. SN42]|uniref:hypothetical protein n=1 Tax=Crossiella sp. SN42 TaxID=2944808 RepID=UPI00207C1DD8|nr:hypothetical protein [Crossiella sp. SN42]MCO1575586.1 hypothetical protein [Crossiella sp. SN42]